MCLFSTCQFALPEECKVMRELDNTLEHTISVVMMFSGVTENKIRERVREPLRGGRSMHTSLVIIWQYKLFFFHKGKEGRERIIIARVEPSRGGQGKITLLNISPRTWINNYVMFTLVRYAPEGIRGLLVYTWQVCQIHNKVFRISRDRKRYELVYIRLPVKVFINLSKQSSAQFSITPRQIGALASNEMCLEERN